MKAIYLARYKAYSLALAHLQEHETITQAVPVFANVYQSAKAVLDEIASAENKRAQKISGATENKEQQREELALQSIAMSSILVSYAQEKKDAALKAEISFSPTELAHATPHELSSRASNILAKVQALEAELKQYGVTDTQIAEFTNQYNLFTTGQHEPRKFISERMQATSVVKENIARLTAIFKEQLDGLMLLFRDSHPEFYEQYLIKRTVVQPGRRKTRVEGMITDKATGEALAGVAVAVKDTAFTTLSAIDGTYYLNVPVLPAAIIVFQKVGYQPKEITVQVKRGQALQQDIAMEK